jgi:chromosome segregation ATPase
VSELDIAVNKALDVRLATVEKSAQWVKWLVYGAFALGVWVATIQLAIDQTRTDVRRLEVQLEESRAEIRRLSEDTAVIKATVSEIKDTVKEIRTDLKERN